VDKLGGLRQFKLKHWAKYIPYFPLYVLYALKISVSQVNFLISRRQLLIQVSYSLLVKFIADPSVDPMYKLKQRISHQDGDHRPRPSWKCAYAMCKATHGDNGLGDDVQIGAAQWCSCHGYQSIAVKKLKVLELQETIVTKFSSHQASNAVTIQ